MTLRLEDASDHTCLMLSLCYVLAAFIMLLIVLTGGTPSVFMNLMYIPIALSSTYTGQRRALIFALLWGIIPAPLMLIVGFGMEPVKQLITRPVTFVIISIIISSLSDFHRDRLIYESTYDTHTGLKKLQALKDSLGSRNRQSDLVMISICNLPAIFNTFSYDFTSQFIREFASTLSTKIRRFPSVELYRLVENGFIVEVPSGPGESQELLDEVVRDLHSVHRSIIIVEEIPVYVELKLGIACRTLGKSPEQNIREASIALKYAQDSGVIDSYFDDELEERYLMQTYVLNNFRHALRNHELSLAAQEIYCSGDAALYSKELLIRWKTESGDFISPAIFVPLIEKTDLIHDLSRFVIDHALAYVKEEQMDTRGIITSINFSSKDFNHANLSYLIEQVKKFEIRKSMVQVEITEESLRETESLQKSIAALKEAGIRIVIDDFGTGYSSYDLLAKLTIDGVKIDRSIIRNIDTDERHRKLTENLVDFCHTFGISTVAEGVETEEVAQACRDAGIDFLQGFLFHRPKMIAGR